MNRLHKYLPHVVVALVGAAILGAPTQAQATFSVRIATLSNPGGTTITDGGAGDLDLLTNGSITVNYGDASYHLVGTISFSNSPGLPGLGILDVSYNINTLGTTGGLATLEASSTGFTQPSANPLTLTSSINGNGQGTGIISVQQWANTADTLFGHGPITPGVQGPFAIAPAYGSTASIQFNQVGAYSVTDLLTFNLSANANTSGDAQSLVTPAPAPASLLLAFSAAPVLGIGRWLRRRRTSI